MPSGLSDDQVASELTKMVEFIKKEAEEKAREIKIKANEEYEIEKADVVRSEVASIDANYEKRYKQAQMSQQIVKSTTANKIRLKVLGAKEEILEELLNAAEQELRKSSKNKKDYKKLLTDLIEEGSKLLKETKIVVRVREADQDVAADAIATAAKDIPEIDFALDTSFLSKDLAGGVVLFDHTGKLSIDNTLEGRLKLLAEKALPRIRLDLFGPSKTRKFFN